MTHNIEDDMPDQLYSNDIELNDLPDIDADAQRMRMDEPNAEDETAGGPMDDLEGQEGAGIGEDIPESDTGNSTEELTHKIVQMIKDSGEDVDEVLAIMAQLTSEEDIDEIDTHSGLDMIDELDVTSDDSEGNVDEIDDIENDIEVGSDIGTEITDTDEITENDLPI